MATPFTLQWPVDSRIITQYFGENPHLYARYHQAGHEGLDFRAPEGANIYACAAGQVFEIRPNDGNAYGLHIRIRHRVNGREYHTIYAHLSRVLVEVGQQISTGTLIGLAGNTGHSYHAHLHLTLKLIGARTPGYPRDVIDPLPYLKDEEQETPPASDLTIYTTDRVRMRSGPTTASTQMAWLGKHEPLTVLGNPQTARQQVGQYGKWIQVQREDGMVGFVAAWYLQLQAPAGSEPEPEPEPEPEQPLPDKLVVFATEPLNVREGPSTASDRIAIALPHEPLTILEETEPALAKLGDRGSWLHVRLPVDEDVTRAEGYVAAWYVGTSPGSKPDALLTVYPTQDMNMRAEPSVRAERIGRPTHNTPLEVRDDITRAQALVGRYDEWFYVETPDGQRGWVAAWYVSSAPT